MKKRKNGKYKNLPPPEPAEPFKMEDLRIVDASEITHVYPNRGGRKAKDEDVLPDARKLKLIPRIAKPKKPKKPTRNKLI